MKAIAAMSDNRVIGSNNGIPWKCKADMKWFKQFTMGKKVLFGRTTYESMPNLPGREVWVLTHGGVAKKREEDHVVRDINDIPSDIIVAGGAKVYNQLLPYCDELFLTVIRGNYEGDTYMPMFEHLFQTYEIIERTEEYGILRYFNVRHAFPQVNC